VVLKKSKVVLSGKVRYECPRLDVPVTVLTTIMGNFTLSSNVIGLIKIYRVRWAGPIARTHKKL